MRKTVVPGLILALLAACTSDGIETQQSPQSSATSFLELIDKGNYEESWTEASTWLRKNVDANQWAEHAGSYRQPLGIVEHRKFNSIEYHESLEDMPAGDYALVFFDSSLSNNASATEIVGLMLDDDSMWRVIGYQTQ